MSIEQHDNSKWKKLLLLAAGAAAAAIAISVVVAKVNKSTKQTVDTQRN